MVRLSNPLGISLVLILILLVGTASPAFAASGDETTVGSLELTATFESISVYSNFSGDNNQNNFASFQWRAAGGSWKQGMALTVDRRAQIYSDEQLVTNQFRNQWRGSILGLSPGAQYEVRVTYTDPNGISGTNTVTRTITTRNDSFTLGSGHTYYVATNGSDSNPGTQALPWRTIQHAADTVAAGDTVSIKAGTYYESVHLTASGTSSNYITFQNYGSDRVVINGGNAESVIVAEISYNRIRGLNIRNAANNGILLDQAASYNVIENCTIEDYGYKIPDAGVAITGGAAYNLIQNNTITTDRDDYSDALHRADGISISRAPGEGNVIRYNNIYAVNEGMSDGVGGWLNERWTDGPYKDCDIYGNTIGPVTDDGIETEGGDINVRIWNNTIYSHGQSMFADAPTIIGPLYIFRNVFYNKNGDAGSRFNKVGNGVMDTGTAYIYHNTCYLVFGNSLGVSNSGGPYFSNFHYVNNIIATSGWIIDMPSTSGSPAQNNTFDYNNLWTYNATGEAGWSEAGFKGFRGRWSGVRYYTLEEFQAGTNQELNGISADPEFVNPDSGDFRLQATSPSIDAGTVLTGFNDSGSPWPYSGNAPDIGVCEYGSGGPPVDSTPPYTSGHSPTKGATGVARDTNIVVHVRDSGTGVNQSSIVMTVEGSVVTPTITGTPSDYTLTYNPPSDFSDGQVVNVTVNARDLAPTPNSMTQDTYSFTIANGGGSSSWPTLPFRVNCAGADYTDSGGNLWNADQAYATGEWGFYGSDNTIDRGTSTPISNTQDDRLFQTERYGLSGYRFDLGNGTYEISLLFAETYHTSAGNRIFDVYVEGQLKLDNLDVYSRVGGNTALIEKISGINVTDGQLNISFGEITELPMINGIMIIPSEENQPPVAASDTYSVEPGDILSVPAPGVLGNDYDVNWDPLSAVLISDVTYGNLTLNVDGSFIYAPDPGYTGADAFSYRASDGQENSNTAIVTISIIEGGGNGGGGGGDDNTEITSVYSYTTSAGKFNIGVTAKSSDDIVEIEIPKDTIGTNKMGVRLTSITIEKLVTNVPPPPDNAIILGDVYNITPDGAIFNPAIYLKMKYSNSQVPYSVAEKNLVIGTYSWSTGKWQLLPSSCDPNNNVVTANLEHLSTYAILACTSPANFEVTGISTSSDSIHCGNNFDIQVTVVNTGDLAGDYEVCLMLDDIALATEYITLDGGDSTIVTFSASTETVGEHTIKIGTKEMKFTVDEAQVPATFTISNINISPSEIYLGESVEIGTMISNTGDLSGIYEVILKMDNKYIESRSIGIAGGDSEIIIFSVVPDTEGEHAINIGDKVVFLKVNSAADADIEIVARPQPEISRFDITPTYNPQTGKIESTRIDYQIENYEELEPGSVLTLKVFRDGEIWEEITLITLNHLEPGEDSGYLSYVPSAGWDIGTYIFEVELQEESGAIHSIQFEKFTLIEESITKAVSWGSLGFIIGGTLVVLLTVLGIIIYRRREMLRGYVE